MWNQLLVVLLGLWLMAAPDLMQYEGPERLNDYIVGPLVVSAAVIALAETTRAVRWTNVALGCWLILAPFILGYSPLHTGVRSSIVGAAVLGLSLIEGPRREHIGGGWAGIWKSERKEKQSGSKPVSPDGGAEPRKRRKTA